MAESGGDHGSELPDLRPFSSPLLDSTSADLVHLPGFGAVPQRALTRYCVGIKDSRIIKNLLSFLAVELKDQTLERPYYALVSYILTHFLDTINVGGNCRASILSCPQPRFQKLISSPAGQGAGAFSAAASPPEPEVASSSHVASEPSQTNGPGSPSANLLPETPSKTPKKGRKKKKNRKKQPAGKDTYRDPDFAQCIYFETVDGILRARKSTESWVEVKPEVELDEQPDDVDELAAKVQLKYESHLVTDMAQLREQADLAFASDPIKNDYIVIYIRGLRFTAFKWYRPGSKQPTPVVDNAPPAQDAGPSHETPTFVSCELADREDSPDLILHDSDSQPEVLLTDESPGGGSQSPQPASEESFLSSDSLGNAEVLPPIPIVDADAFKGAFSWEAEQRVEYVKAAEATKAEFWRNEVLAHQGRIPADALARLKEEYMETVSAESIVASHPYPMYHFGNVLEGEDLELHSGHQFTNTLRLAHSNLNPTGEVTFEFSNFFSVLEDENHYRPSADELQEAAKLMKLIYMQRLREEWRQEFEDIRASSASPEVGNTSNTTCHTEGTHSSNSSLGDMWGDIDIDAELEELGIPIPSRVDNSTAPVSPGPDPRGDDEPSNTVSPNKQVYFDDDTFATTVSSNQAVETARPRTRSATRISQGNETNSQSASSSGPRAPDTGPPGPSTQEASTSGARERERKKTGGPGGTRRPVALEANATRTTTTRPKTTRTATSQTASTRAIDTQSNSGAAVVRSTRSTGSTANAPSGRSTANANVPAADGGGGGPSMAGPSRPRRAGARYDAPTKSSKAKSTATKAKDAVKASGSGTNTMDRKGKKRLREEVNLEPDEPPDRQEPPPKKKKR